MDELSCGTCRMILAEMKDERARDTRRCCDCHSLIRYTRSPKAALVRWKKLRDARKARHLAWRKEQIAAGVKLYVPSERRRG